MEGPPVDPQKRRTDQGTRTTSRDLDFRALRYTYVTFLARSGVSPRVLQVLSRHSDPKLSANVYTAASKLDTVHAIKGLPAFLTGEDGTRIRTRFADVFESSGVSSWQASESPGC